MDEKPNFFREAPTTVVGWISRKILALRSREKFFLDIPFIELIDLVLNESKRFCYGRIRKLPIPNAMSGGQEV